MKKQAKCTIMSLAIVLVSFSVAWAGRISGELKTWHKITLTFEGP